MRKTRNKKPSEVDNTRLTLTTTLRALRNAVNGKRMIYRPYMEIARALGGAKKYGRDTPINLRWIVDTFPKLPHVVYLQFCEGQRCRLMRQLLYAFCQNITEELSLGERFHLDADRCIDYLRAALAGDAFNSRTAEARIRRIERIGAGALLRYCDDVCTFVKAVRKQTDPAAADFDVLYPSFISAVNNFHTFMSDGRLVETLTDAPAPHAWEFMRRALVSFLRPRKV